MKPEESEFRSYCLHAERVRSDARLRNICATTFLTILLLLLPSAVQAQFNFTTNNGTITIKQYTGTNQNVSIPNTTNGYPVTGIASSEFGILGPQSSVTNVTIPDSVTNIGFSAFEFYSYPGGPPPDTFLNTITVDTNNSVYCSVDGVLIDKIHGTLIQYPCGNAATQYTIPNSVTNIAEDAFYFSTNLISVTIPDGVTNIGDSAFTWCSSLTNATIGNGVTNIGNYAFMDCLSLTNVTIGNGVTNIGFYAFFGCDSLKGVYFTGNSPSQRGFIEFVFTSGNAIAYYLPRTTGLGVTFDGLPTALWLPQMQSHNASFGVQSNQFGFNINWAGGQTVVVEACTNLANPTWFPIQTNTLATGSSYFSDPQWTNYPGRYYRFRSP
jgi:hypothetical protein